MGRNTRTALVSAAQALFLAGLVNVLTALLKPEWIRPWWWAISAVLIVAFFLPFYRQQRREQTISRVAITSDGDGTLHLFGVTRGGAVLSRQYRQGGSWSAWEDFGLRKAKAWDIAAVVPVSGGLEAYAVDRSGSIWYRRQEARTEWSTWTRLRSNQRVGPAIALDAISGWPGHRELFVVSESGKVGHCSRWDGKPWSDWYEVGKSSCRDVALSSTTPGHIECFVVDRQGMLWHRWYLNQHWSDWASLGEPYGMSAPVAISALNGEERHQEVFVVGASGEVAHRWHWQGEIWDRWYDMPSPDHLVDIAAGITSKGRFEVIAVGSSGRLWQRSYVPVGNWSAWESL